MSQVKYLPKPKKNKKHRRSFSDRGAAFPDGDEDETDSSSRSTFYNICRQSSTSTSYSERSSCDDPNSGERTKSFQIDDEVFFKFNAISSSDKDESLDTVVTAIQTTTTALSYVDIRVPSPKKYRQEVPRPACTTRIRDDMENLYEEVEKEEARAITPKHESEICNPPDVYFRRNKLMLPSIDVSCPSPSLSTLSERSSIKKPEGLERLLHPGPPLSRISCRTLSPLSFSSGGSTISGSFSPMTSSSGENLHGHSVFNRLTVLPPISRASSNSEKFGKKKSKSTDDFPDKRSEKNSEIYREDRVTTRRENFYRQTNVMSRDLDNPYRSSPKREKHTSKSTKQNRGKKHDQTKERKKQHSDGTQKGATGHTQTKKGKIKSEKKHRKNSTAKQREEYLSNYYRVHTNECHDSRIVFPTETFIPKKPGPPTDSSDSTSLRSEQTSSSYVNV